MLAYMAFDWLADNRPDVFRCFADWEGDCDSADARQTYAEAARWYLAAIAGDPERRGT